MKSIVFSDVLDGGKCTSNVTSIANVDGAFAIGAYVPGLGFRCGCFPSSNQNIKAQHGQLDEIVSKHSNIGWFGKDWQKED